MTIPNWAADIHDQVSTALIFSGDPVAQFDYIEPDESEWAAHTFIFKPRWKEVVGGKDDGLLTQPVLGRVDILQIHSIFDRVDSYLYHQHSVGEPFINIQGTILGREACVKVYFTASRANAAVGGLLRES